MFPCFLCFARWSPNPFDLGKESPETMRKRRTYCNFLSHFKLQHISPTFEDERWNGVVIATKMRVLAMQEWKSCLTIIFQALLLMAEKEHHLPSTSIFGYPLKFDPLGISKTSFFHEADWIGLPGEPWQLWNMRGNQHPLIVTILLRHPRNLTYRYKVGPY